MDLRQIRYFVAVAEQLSFSRAAERLHVSQPPLSRQIANLEAALGFDLFDRSSRQIKLTSAGTEFLSHARHAMQTLEQAKASAERVASGAVGTVSLAFGGSLSYFVLPPVLREFRRRFPLIELSLQSVPISKHAECVQGGRADVGLVVLPLHNESLVNAMSLRDELVVALPEDHKLASRTSLEMIDLKNETFIPFSIGEVVSYADKLNGLCRAAGFVPTTATNVGNLDSMAGVVGLVSVGIGVAIVPGVVRRVGIDGVVFRQLAKSSVYLDFALIRENRPPGPALKNFLEVAEAILLPHGNPF
jgi:DNA-binding transcriptional LysR family regulator